MGSSSLLGPDHPLARAELRSGILRAQLGVTVAFGLAAAALSPLLGPAAERLAVGAVVVAGLFLFATLIARARLRARAFELIASGREELPLRVVADESSRLRDRRYRVRLARTLDVITLQPETRDWWRPVCGDHEAVRAARGELLEIAQLLRDLPNVRARGVALVTHLVWDGATSPLYQCSASRLREELGRIRHVLIDA
jgi:hypothetical protein